MLKPEIQNLKKAVHGGEVWDYKKIPLDFSSNINPLGPSKKAIEAIKRDLWKVKYYPDNEAKELKEALSVHLGLNPENITIGNGSTELIKNFCEAFISRGDEVAIVAPAFSEYEVFCRLYGGKVKHILAKEENNFEFETEKIIEESRNSKILFLCSPNNPTGKILEVEEIIEAVKRDCFVFLDEAYIDFTDFESMCSRIEFENLFVIRSLTKFFSLPGLRIGYGTGNKKIVEYLEKIRIPWNVNAVAQTAAVASINDKEFVRKSKEFIKKEKKFLFREFRKLFKIYSSETNFFLVKLPSGTAPEIRRMLIEKGILIRDCSSFVGLNRYFIRISLRKHTENLMLLKEVVNAKERL